MFNESTVLIICATILAISGVLSILVYNVQENNLKSQNIETAIAKGIDPLSVRCSYASRQDILCIAYAASKK
jgi:ABC-type dipeptide/oligopeptide/nickel transport system permease component